MTIIEKLTKMPEEAQNQQLRFFARADLETKLTILEIQVQLFHKLRSIKRDIENSKLMLVALILSIHRAISAMDQLDLNVIRLRSKNNKGQLMRAKLLGSWAIIKKLKDDQKMTFDEISKYLQNNHKLKIPYPTHNAG